MNYDELIETSEQHTLRLVELEQKAYDAFVEELGAQDNWDRVYYEFTLNEGNYDVPGGGRWNDTKRLGYCKDHFGADWDRLQRAKWNAQEVSTDIRQVKAQISGINRLLRILEIADVPTDS